MITEYSSNNCSDNISLSPPYDTVDVIAEATRNNATIICDEFHLLISDDQRIFVQVKSTNAIAFTFIACALLLFFYSCCWFNRFYLCENRAASSARSFSNAAVRSAAMAAVAVISDRSLRCTGGCSRSNYPTTPREECCAIDIDQTHSPELPEITRRQMDMDLESLPSYTICSGLPTYDDALDQFRKYGIILQPPSVIKIFEDNKEKDKSKTDASAPTGNGENDDNISMTSTCTCGANNGGVANIASISNQNLALVPNVIELNPEQLQMLSNKRLSMQIALNNGIGLNNSIRRSNRGSRVNLFREVSRNNLLRTHEIPSIHRSASQQSLYQDQLLAQRFRNAQHRGSLC
ncbi:uncharacterized protein LOC119649602 isoform X1 [Hermetia illucens]|uniref:uncharacterized protein LOC119649602 isoform X1 n=1 Tax=Hermetia illucens TaxID=343691 RepID=UPI0018CC5554|nr:uncharacterized protein LOC119649602 isoform X1 [Hermetia illucens]